jgi:phage terminase large subunit
MADEQLEGPVIRDRIKGESKFAYAALCDYCYMGSGRSLRRLLKRYLELNDKDPLVRAPTTREGTLSTWSSKFGWVEVAEAYDKYFAQKAQAAVEERWRDLIMGSTEVLGRLSEMGRVNIGEFITTKQVPLTLRDGSVVLDPETGKPFMREIWEIDLDKVKANGHLVKSITSTQYGPKIEMWGENPSLVTLGKHHRLFDNQIEDKSQNADAAPFVFPADVLAQSFINVYRDSRDSKHMEYLLKGGRGSTKSSFTSLDLVYLLVTHPTVHALAMRQVANTLRDSVYSQIVWAIGTLGLSDSFNATTSPLEIEYKPTGQKIYFRGADKPEMIKSIKPTFGHIGILWFEELDQFHGQEAIRKIEQSTLRGGEEAWEFKTYNPPRTAANWVNKYVLIPKANQLQHHSTYLDVPPEWLGKTFIDEAEHLKAVNPAAYEHEYLGWVNGTGGMVFENVKIRKITDEEIATFEHILFGLDFGYFPDPLHWLKMHYNPATLTLFIFDEFRAFKTKNRKLYEVLTKEKGMTPADLLIADSEDPKSIADLREYGLACRGAEKGPGSLDYSMKWMQSLAAIIIDNERCPYAAEEFLNYEFEKDKEDNFISAYPDKNDHGIAAGRYGTNLIWRRRGQ